MRYDTKEQEEHVQAALQQLIMAATPNRDALFAVLVDFAGFVPPGGWKNVRKRSNGFYQKGDEDAPFMSEGFTYWLVDKEDGRTILALFHTICRVCGFDPYEIQQAVYEKREVAGRQAAEWKKRNEMASEKRAEKRKAAEK